jgi:membrane fusion protein (multidrug efflux system)
MKTRIVGVVGFFLFLFLATFIFYGVKVALFHWFTAHYEEPPVSVSAVKVESKSWSPFLTTIGTLKASSGVEVNAEVSGQVVSIDFQSGQHVKQGDLLVQLNDNVDQKTLQKDEAKLRFDKIDYERKESLLKDNAVARSAVDAAKAAFLQSEAAVASDQVMIAQKKIRAPFAGKIGIRQINLGQYITTGTPIVTLQALNPLYVDFSLPEQNLPLIHTNQDVLIKVDAYPTQLFQGKITAMNSAVDVNTRSIAVRATLPNPNELLYPGIFADVRIVLPKKENVLTVPQSAITYSLYGDAVYLVKTQGKDKQGQPLLVATQQYVKVGDHRDNDVAVLSGLKVGDEVITSGQIKLRDHARVKINNTVTLQ